MQDRSRRSHRRVNSAAGGSFTKSAMLVERLAGELEVVLAHPVIAPPACGTRSHHREVAGDMLRQGRRSEAFSLHSEVGVSR